MTNFSKKKCLPCEGGIPALTPEQIQGYLLQISGWQVSRGKVLIKNFKMKNFQAVIDFVNKIAVCAEAEGHHPDLHIYGYKNLKIELSTHAIDGLSENDFILAARIDGVL